MLKQLGLPHKHGDRIYLRDLAAIFKEECYPQQSSGIFLPSHLALLTLLHESKGLRLSLESAHGERDKFHFDLNEANHRLALLAQELDDHNTSMEERTHQQIQSLERRYKDNLRELQESMSKEREIGREKALIESKELFSLNLQLQEEEANLKMCNSALEKDVQRLENENLELCDKFNAATQHVHMLEKQLGELNHWKNKVVEYESLSPREDELRSVLQRVEELTMENKSLRDSNDELISQLDIFASSRYHPTRAEERSLDGSCIGDYLDQSGDGCFQGSLKKRGFRSSAEDDCSGQECESPRESKIRKKGSMTDCIDLKSFDESSLDNSVLSGSFDIRDYSQPFPGTPGTALSQPSSLPVTLLLPSLGLGALEFRKKLDKKKKIEELEKEVVELKEEKQRLSNIVEELQKKLKGVKIEDPKEEFGIMEETSPLTGYKCWQCIDLEKRLTMMMDELQMALKREEQNQSDSEIEQNMAMRMHLLIERCKELEEDLKTVRSEVVKLVEERNLLILVEKKKMNEVVLATVASCCRELTAKLRRKRKVLLQSTESNTSSHHDVITTIVEEDEEDEPTPGKRDAYSISSEKEEEVGFDSSPGGARDGERRGVETVDSLRREMEILENEINLFEEEMDRERDFLEKQKAIAEEKCTKTENDLERLRCDFEKCDDYWQLKLREEEEYYEEERKLFDEKFIALEAKIREYDEMSLSVPDIPKEILNPPVGTEGLEDWDKLSTIEESAVWEKQITELEEENNKLHRTIGQITTDKENLEKLWKEKLNMQQRNAELEVLKLKNDLQQTRVVFNELESQATCTRDQLEYLQRRLSHDNEAHSAKECLNKDSGTHCEDSKLVVHLRGQLFQQQKRSKQLQSRLKIQQFHSAEVLRLTNERHQCEVEYLQTMVSSTEQMLNSCLAQYKDQLMRASRSDILIKDLYIESAHLMLAIKVTEGRQKEAEDCSRKYQLAAMSSANS